MHLITKFLFCACLTVCFTCTDSALKAGKSKTSVIEDITDIKDFKKLLRSKTNVLVCFVSAPGAKTNVVLKAFKEASDVIKGHGTMVIVDCSGNTKKMCRKLKVNDVLPFQIKHYKDGEFYKNYDRKNTVPSIINFMRDPTGGLPWEEDPSAADVIHLSDPESLSRFLRKGPVLNRPSIIMFFAPWCSYCKTLKPEFASAATDLKGEAFLAAVDVSRPENSGLIQQYNISVFPTLLFYENGKFKFTYEGENNRAALVEFMRDPQPYQKNPLKSHVPKEKDWALTVSDVIHLTSDTFDPMLKEEESALVVFHAPWCGHCKKIKPEYERAATLLKDRGITGMLGAVDATKEPELASRFGIRGYPTIKYFAHGEFKYDITAREESKIVEFMKDPKEPTPPPPPESMWPEPNNVVILQQAEFRTILKKKKHALIMFYAPWCGYCKRIKPEYMNVAAAYKDDSRTIIGAVDCTEQSTLCQEYGVKGYPTIKYFSYYDKNRQDYQGGRTAEDMVEFLKDPHRFPGSKSTVQSEGFKSKEAIDDSKSMDNIDNSNTGQNPLSKHESQVMALTDASFSHVISSPEPTLVMFYVQKCALCAVSRPYYEAASLAVIKEGLPIKLRMIDCNNNNKTAKLYKIHSFPSFILYKNGRNVNEFKGDPTTEEFLVFVKKNIMKDEL